MKALGLEAAAEMLGVSKRSLADKRFRCRIGLPARKIGSRVVFVQADCVRVLERAKESFPGERRDE